MGIVEFRFSDSLSNSIFRVLRHAPRRRFATCSRARRPRSHRKRPNPCEVFAQNDFRKPRNMHTDVMKVREMILSNRPICRQAGPGV